MSLLGQAAIYIGQRGYWFITLHTVASYCKYLSLNLLIPLLVENLQIIVVNVTPVEHAKDLTFSTTANFHKVIIIMFQILKQLYP